MAIFNPTFRQFLCGHRSQPLPLSRRQFLQLTGIAVLGSAVGLPEMPIVSAAYGRTFVAAPVRPNPAAPITHHLWPDSVLPITALPGGWYRTNEGYIEKVHMQPIMMPEPTSQAPVQPPFWAAVSAPVATVRKWCAADAPLITRIGHGGVMLVIDLLPGDPVWYGLADEKGNLLGWTQATGWQPINPSYKQMPLEIHIDQRRQHMHVISGSIPVVQAAISMGRSLTPGVYPVERSDVAGTRYSDYYGAAWPLQFGDAQSITGVYWHNQFGAAIPGPAVQVPVYLARWLYDACARGSQIVVF
jgi:hypothetical protein